MRTSAMRSRIEGMVWIAMPALSTRTAAHSTRTSAEPATSPAAALSAAGAERAVPHLAPHLRRHLEPHCLSHRHLVLLLLQESARLGQAHCGVLLLLRSAS